MPRRIYRYGANFGWNIWNMMSTIGAFLIAVSILVFVYNVVRSLRRGEASGSDPWDARTLEWSIDSPPKVHNFDEVPVVHAVDDFWHRKYAEGEDGRLVPAVTGASDGEAHSAGAATSHGGHDDHGGHAIHMPSPSYWPVVAALGLPVLAYGLLFSVLLAVDGVLLLLLGLFAWANEPSAA
jgi:cytochrome c oxidase subunit 1